MPAQIPTQPPTKATTTPDQSAEKKFDKFRPEMPQIPGVINANALADQRAKSAAREQLIRSVGRIGGIVAIVVAIVIAFLWWIRSVPRRAAEAVAPEPTAAEAPVPDPLGSIVPVHDGPTVAATVDELSKPWAAKKFTFVTPVTQENVEAIVIRLPTDGLWAFALKEPYGTCNLEFVTNLAQIETKYGYHASHPMVVDSCNGTVYDPLKVGPVGGNIWIRGEIVQGGGLRPPISIDVQIKGRSIIADRIE